jgi:chlorite dismutase
MFAFDRRRFGALPESQRVSLTRETIEFLQPLFDARDSDAGLAQLLGHKADLMLTHYASSFEELGAAQMGFDRLGLAVYLRPASSYVSILELGLYEATGRIHSELRERALKPHSPEWDAAFDELLEHEAHNPRNAARLFAKIAPRRYVCFYPMNKRRGEHANWYALPFTERARLMQDHGRVGRSFAGLVTQVISASLGFDDYEWGVDLYADDPAVFKRLVYEMRFDETSARYGEFGPFFTGMQFSIPQLGVYLDGDTVPQLQTRETIERDALTVQGATNGMEMR